MNALFLAILLTAAPPTFEIQTLDGKTLIGSLVDLSSGRLTIDAPSGRVTLEAENLLSVSAREKQPTARPAPRVIVDLMDGSSVFARQYTTHETQAKITLSNDAVLETPVKNVRTVQLQPDSGSLSAEWARLAGKKADGDLLAVRKTENLDYHLGVLHDVSDDTVQFNLDGELLSIKRPKVFGLAYRRGTEPELPQAVCRITDSAGSQWPVQSLHISDKLEWTTPGGLRIEQPADKIVQIDFSGGKVVYLSDLKPESVRWTPYFGLGKLPESVERFYAPRFNRNFNGTPLQLGGTQYPKGLALHTRTELVYRLPDAFRRFTAVMGIDKAEQPNGKVRLRVRGDDKDLLDVALSGTDAPRPIGLDLSGVRRLTIVADFGDSPSIGGYLLLCNARLSK